MKKMLSLLLAAAMLLSLTGVAVATTGGQLLDGDNTIELPWDSREASVYTYTATATGTLYIMATAFYYADGDTNYLNNSENMDEWSMYTELRIDGELLENDYFGQIDVVEGQTYTFSWTHHPEVIDVNWYHLGWRAVLNLSFSGELVPEEGSETMPVELRRDQCPTQSIEIPAGETRYYLLYDFGGAHFTVTGENAYVQVTGFNMELGQQMTVAYEAKNGVVTVPVELYYTTIQIGNAGEESAVFTLDYYYPLGSWENPAQMAEGKNVATTVADNYDGYYFTWTAQCDGILTLTFPEEGWMYSIVNLGNDVGELFYTYDSEDAENPMEMEVSKGDVIILNLNSYNARTYSVPGGDVTVTLSVSYDHRYVDGVCQDCGEEEVLYIVGDANCDGRVNVRDARTILRYVAGLIGESDLDLDAADYNGDGRVNVRDARAILRHVAGLD